MDDEAHESAESEESSPLDRGCVVAALSLVWLVTGCVVFVGFAIIAFALNPLAPDDVFESEGYRNAVLMWHLPMMWGWVPAVYRSARRRRKPWRNAARTLLLGVCLGPLLFLLSMLVWRVVMQASASI